VALVDVREDPVLEVTADSVRILPGGDSSDDGGRAPRALIDAAIGWIDDPVGLLEERPVAVADIWRSLMVALVGERCHSIVVVHPPDWPRHRIGRVVAAANSVAEHVEAVSRDRWHAEVDDGPGQDGPVEDGRPVRPRRLLVTALLAAGAVVVPAAVALTGRVATAPKGAPGVSVAEGRMAVRIPAHWTVERVTGGPGSRRLQVSPPQDPAIALHLTSSYAPETTLEQAADVLGRAIAAEIPGVFVDMRGAVEVAGRPAVTYREVRPGRVIAWSVVLAGATRISIGCQSPPGREADVRAACDEAVRSAREK
jgi:type VII secretion-associated protein (TIGR03931 family)